MDGVPQLAVQHQARILFPVLQARVERQFAVFAQPDQLQLAQLLDEAAEQRFVEEFRRRRRVQQATGAGRSDGRGVSSSEALSVRGAVLDQGGDGDEVALERLLQAVRDRAQAEHLVGLARAARTGMPPSSSLDAVSRPSRMNRSMVAFRRSANSSSDPGQEQLFLHERIDGQAQPHQAVRDSCGGCSGSTAPSRPAAANRCSTLLRK